MPYLTSLLCQTLSGAGVSSARCVTNIQAFFKGEVRDDGLLAWIRRKPLRSCYILTDRTVSGSLSLL